MPVDTHHAAEHLRRRIADTRKRRRVTLAVAASVVAAVAVTAAGGWLGVDKADDPAQNPDQSVAVAREFLDAVGRFDADAAISYLTSRCHRSGRFVESRARTAAEQLRLTLAMTGPQAISKRSRTACIRATRRSGVSVSCAFDLHAIRSDEIGLGPYTGNYWRLTVRDGKIVSARRKSIATSGFGDQIWEPFATWVSINHPDDILTMCIDREPWGCSGIPRTRTGSGSSAALNT